ncbi:type VI secretion system baseplate subunit TssF [Escherichia coli]|nr:type VI secretion system baseplate subunit TssF [Escherichia coli]
MSGSALTDGFHPAVLQKKIGCGTKGDSAFSGYQLLLEYFTFREKFMFIHLNGLENVSLPAGISGFDLEVVLSQPWSADLPVTDDALCLHCVPVINLLRLKPIHSSSMGWRANTCCARSVCRMGIRRYIQWMR